MPGSAAVKRSPRAPGLCPAATRRQKRTQRSETTEGGTTESGSGAETVGVGGGGW